ncbi:MAG: hypothetical protein ACE5FD_19840 [Anaerolineae bacterium]
MADVYTVTFIIIGILLSVPALLVALNLLLPNVTRRAQTRLEKTPGRSFFLGVPVTAAFALFVAIASATNFGPIQAIGFVAALVGMGLGSIGGAGLARLLGERLTPLAHPNSELTNLVRGAVVYELAALVPLVGWFLFIPIAGMMAMGAATFALFKWLPRPAVTEQANEQTVIIGNQ